jgi:hypothetical protein
MKSLVKLSLAVGRRLLELILYRIISKLAEVEFEIGVIIVALNLFYFYFPLLSFILNANEKRKLGIVLVQERKQSCFNFD